MLHVNEVGRQALTLRLDLIGRGSAHLTDTREPTVDVRAVEGGAGEEDHQVRGIGDLALAEGVRHQLLPYGAVGYDQEAPGLQAAGRSRIEEGLLQGRPMAGRDGAGRVVFLGSIAPLAEGDELIGFEDGDLVGDQPRYGGCGGDG